MTKIAIIGHTIAGISFAGKIKAAAPSTEIILFTLGRERPYARHQLPDYCAGLVSDEQIFYRPKGYLQTLGILRVDSKVVRVNLRKNIILTEDKQDYEFDTLVVTDADQAKITEIKGANKSGIFSLSGNPEPVMFSQALQLAETVVIRLDSLLALKMAVAARKKNLETIVVAPQQQLLPEYLDPVSARMISESMDSAGIRILTGQEIQEVLGDNDVKAVRLSSGKVIGCQMLILGQGRPELRMWKDAGLSAEARITVDPRFRTSASNVFAVDAVNDLVFKAGLEDFDDYSSIVEGQGEALAQIVAGSDPSMDLPVLTSCFSVGGSVFDLVGRPVYGEESFVYENRPSGGCLVYRRISACEGKIAGAVLMNASDQVPAIKEMIERQSPARAAILSVLLPPLPIGESTAVQEDIFTCLQPTTA